MEARFFDKGLAFFITEGDMDYEGEFIYHGFGTDGGISRRVVEGLVSGGGIEQDF